MAATLIKQNINWVDSDEILRTLCRKWKNHSLLAIDTEFMRSQTYYPIVGLIQVNDGEENYLIDPKRVNDFSLFIDLLTDESIVKVIHSCSEDLDVLHSEFGVLPSNLFDTQIAAAVVGYGYSIGYANLVKLALDVDLPKNETRSDWLQRPLSQSQINYAAIDVEYLYVLAGELIKHLNKLDRYEWVRQDCMTLVENYVDNLSPENTIRRIKSAWKLSPMQLVILQDLCQWRELKARSRNVPRNRVVKEQTLFLIAQKCPVREPKLRKIDGLTERMIRADGKEILAIVAHGMSLSQDELPHCLPKPLSPAQGELLKALKSMACEVANTINVPNELLVKKKDFEFLIREFCQDKGLNEIPDSLKGWREAVVTEKLIDTLSKIKQMPEESQ